MRARTSCRTSIEQVRSKPGQPILYLPQTSIPYFLFYRADWLAEAKLKPPQTYDEFITACRAISKPPDRYGIAMRGQTYSAIQVILPIWASAGVKFVDEKGNVDFDSPAAIGVTEKWVALLTKDNAAQPTAVSDGYREQYALMEKGKCGMWYYGPHGSPALIKALGDNIQAVNNPRVGPNHYMLANPEGPLMTTSCKEKEAAWEFMKFIALGRRAAPVHRQAHGPAGAQVVLQQRGLREQPVHQDVAGGLQHLVHAALLPEELGEFPGQDPAVLAGGAAPEDHGARVPRAGRQVPARPGEPRRQEE